MLIQYCLIMDSNKFKSMQKNIECLQDILDISCDILPYQEDFEKHIPPEEYKEWCENELRNMTIKIKLIDRLFYVECKHTRKGYEDYLLARQIVNDVPIYFEMYGFTNHNEPPEYWGEILYCKSPKTFIENCNFTDCVKERLYNFLEQSYEKEKHQCLNCERNVTFISQVFGSK